MKKILTAAFLSTSLFASTPALEKFEQLLPIKGLGVKVKGVQEYGDLYVLDGSVDTGKGIKNITFTVTKDMKYTFFGSAFDNMSAKEVVYKKDMTKYIEKANFTYGTGKDEFLVFTDPQCPYCKKFEKALKQMNIEDKVKIHYFMFPLGFHDKAVDMSRFILNQSSNKLKLSASYDITAMGSTIYKDVPYTKEQLKKLDGIIAENKKIVEELGIMGTPTLIDSNGQNINIGQFFRRYSK